MEERSKYSLYVRNFIFGIEDSLVSTVGLLSGIAAGDIPRATLLLTGLIYIFVEAFSMAVGSFLSEESAEEYVAGTPVPNRMPVFGGLIMFASFVIAGFVPIFPYVVFKGSGALYGSILLSLLVLLALGLVNGRISRVKPWPRAIRMVVLGGLAIGVGVLVSKLFKVS